MTLRIGDTAPDFPRKQPRDRLNSTSGLGNSWGVLVLAPQGLYAGMHHEGGLHGRARTGVRSATARLLRLSVDPVASHSKWAADIEETQGNKVTFPMIGDPELKIAKLYGNNAAGRRRLARRPRTGARQPTTRPCARFSWSAPTRKIKLTLSYPMSTGRNFDEVLRVVDSMQLTAKHRVSTPVNWKPGDSVIISGSVTDEEARKKYPEGWKAPRPYPALRFPG